MSSQRRLSWRRKDSGNLPNSPHRLSIHGFPTVGLSHIHPSAAPAWDKPIEVPRNFPIFQLVKLAGIRANTNANANTNSSTGVSNHRDNRTVYGSNSSSTSHLSRTASEFGDDTNFTTKHGSGVTFSSSEGSEATRGYSLRDCTVSVSCVSVGEHQFNKFMALYLSNDNLIFRYVGKAGLPIVKQLKWFKDQSKRIIAMTFSHDVEWFLCLSTDCSIIILPTQLILRQDASVEQYSTNVPRYTQPMSPARSIAPISMATSFEEEDKGNAKQNSDRWKFPSLLNFARNQTPPESNLPSKKPSAWNHNDITVIPPTPTRVGSISCCRWWPCQSGVDYVITSTTEGVIMAINLQTQTEHVLSRLKHPITSFGLVNDPKENYRMLLIQTKSGGCYRLLLEAHGNGGYDNIIQTPTRTIFATTPLTKFPQALTVTKQEIHQQPVFGVYQPSNQKLEIYDEDFNKYPLFVYRLPSGTVQYHLTERFIFVVCKDQQGEKIVVISNLIAGTSSDHSHKYSKATFSGGSPTRQQIESVMQEFRIHGNQSVLGLFRAPRKNRTSEGTSENILLEGVYVWLSDGIYELRPKQAPEQIFKRLVMDGHDAHAESLGKTIGLDLLGLYEELADETFERDDLDRALQLYNLSNVSTSKLIFKFIEKDRLDVVMSILRKLLSDRDALPIALSRKLSDVTLRCYIYMILSTGTEKGSMDDEKIKEFASFLKENSDYNAASALIHLISAGLKDQFLNVAHYRELMPRALSMLVNRGNLKIGTNELGYLLEKGYGDLLQVSADGILLDCLSVSKQLQVIMEDVRGVAIHYNRLNNLLPLLKKKELIELANFLDPNGQSFPQLAQKLHEDISRRSGEAHASTEIEEKVPLRVDALVELYLSVLLACASIHQDEPMQPFLQAPQLQTPSIDRTGAPDFSNKPDEGPKHHRISCGWSHSAIVTTKGALYTTGSNDFGQLGHGNTRAYLQFTRVMSLKSTRIIDVCCGAEHTMALGENGSVYVWGRGQHGQLGLGLPFHQHVPRLLDPGLFNGKVIAIACGHYHSLALTEKGCVYSWGSNSHGQIGVGSGNRKTSFSELRGTTRSNTITDIRTSMSPETKSVDFKNDQLFPVHITNLDGRHIVKIAAGFCHSMALSENGDLYSWGGGQSGQLGLGTTRDQYMPQRIDTGGKRFVSVSCGAFHTVALTDIGGVYTWGKGSKHRLGHPENLADTIVPKWVAGLRGVFIHKAACGHYHNIVFSMETNEIFVWGENSVSQLGLGVNENKAVPTVAPFSFPAPIKELCCGEEYCFVILENNQVYSWGRADGGRLGLGMVGSSSVNTPSVVDLFMDGPIPTGLHFESQSGNTSLVYGQKALEECLRDRFRFYRPTVMLRRCFDWSNWSAASIIYEQMEDWPEALECKLKAIDEENHELRGHQITEESIQPIFSFLSRTRSDEGRTRVLLQLFKFWRATSLPIRHLEKFLLEHADSLMVPMAALFDTPEMTALPFSPNIQFTVASYILQSTRDHKEEGQIPHERLWTEIKTNLEKDIDLRTRITIPLVTAQVLTSDSTSDDEFEIASFTCGHTYRRKMLLEKVIPEFLQFISLIPKLDSTAQILATDFRNSCVAQACPVCVYNRLRQEIGPASAPNWIG